jgi:hypothetical protein
MHGSTSITPMPGSARRIANRTNRRCRVMIGVALISGSAWAQSANGAREHFANGLALVQRGDLDSAAEEFEEAYRISPNYLVLYNLGQAYVALGKPIEAVRAFENYLELGADRITAARREEIEDLVRLSNKRIGHVSFAVDPSGGEVFVDGRAVGKVPSSNPVALVVGTHGVTVAVPGYAPFAGSIEVLPQKTVTLEIRLQRAASTAPAKLGQLVMACSLLDTHLTLDGGVEQFGCSEPLLLTLGHHTVTCQRVGYAAQTADVDIADGTVSHAACDLVALTQLSQTQAAFLTLRIDQPGADVRIDGRSGHAALRLPVGPHRVQVHRSGFEDWQQIIAIRAGFPDITDVHLRITAEHAAELRDATSSRRTWSYVIGGVGLSLIAASAITYAENGSRYASWKKDSDAFSSDIQNQHWSPTLNTQANELQSRAASIQARDDLAVGGATAGVVALGYAIVSWASASSSY